MNKTLIAGLFVTAVATFPLAARADWDSLKQRGATLEQEGKDTKARGEELEARGKELEAKGARTEAQAKSAYDKGRVVEHKTVSTHHGHNYAKTTTTTTKVHKE